MVKNSQRLELVKLHFQTIRGSSVGRFLRKTKINELPQIVNILKGDIGVVGPRPMVPNTFAKYPKNNKEIIMNVKPG